uniref:Small ribosomal subunit protein mS26 n=1 Tax=Aceria tosichella TaxID=561515 RepID=A0A6G1SJF6_9ACAR
MLFTSLGQRIVVRFARKPIWMPTAPSKLFRIAEHTFYDDEESKQIRKLQVAYSAQMESIQKYMEREFYIPATQAGGLPTEFVEHEKEEDKLIYQENEQINAEIAKKRAMYFENLVHELEEQVMEEKMAREEALIEAAEKVDEFVKKHKDDPNCFVTPENFDTLIEQIIDHPVTYEFYIDKQGRKHGLDAIREKKVN